MVNKANRIIYFSCFCIRGRLPVRGKPKYLLLLLIECKFMVSGTSYHSSASIDIKIYFIGMLFKINILWNFVSTPRIKTIVVFCLCNTAFINLTHMKPQMYFLSLSLILIKCPKKLRGTNYMITFSDIFSYWLHHVVLRDSRPRNLRVCCCRRRLVSSNFKLIITRPYRLLLAN